MSLALQRSQRARKKQLWAVAVAAAVLILVSAPVLPPHHPMALAKEGLGGIVILLAVAGRVWATSYIGGRKKRELVTTGPFSLSRNPLYLFSALGAFGIGLSTGSLLIGLALGAGVVAVLHQMIRSEEVFLSQRFGPAFETYCRDTPRWLSPRARWRPADDYDPSRERVLYSLRDSGAMLLAIPLVQLVDYLQHQTPLPILLAIP